MSRQSPRSGKGPPKPAVTAELGEEDQPLTPTSLMWLDGPTPKKPPAQEEGLKQGMERLRVELKGVLIAELRSGLELLQHEWGDPLNEKSKLRRGLREELQAQLQAAAAGQESKGPLRLVGNGCRAPGAAVIKDRQRALGPDGSDAVCLEDEQATENLPDNILSARGVLSVPPDPEQAPDSASSPSVSHKKEDPEHSKAERADEPSTKDAPRHTASMNEVCRLRDMLRRDPSWWDTHKGSGWVKQLRRACAKLANGNVYFDTVVGFLIVTNSIFIGLQIQWDLEGAIGKLEVVRAAEHVFLVVFVIELGIRLLAQGAKAWHSGWFVFDFVLVGIGVLSSWILEPLMGNMNAEEGILGIVSQVLIIRVLRLLRLIRSLRLMEAFQELWKLASGLMSSIRTVLSACLLIMITVYIFAGFGIELITRNEALLDDEVCREVIDAHFGSLPMTVLTLVQFANADSIAGVYVPLISKAGYLVFYFGMVWLVVTVSLMNLVTGVIVDRAISQGSMDREMEMYTKRKMLKNLTPFMHNVFRALDEDGNGKLEIDDVREGLKKLERIPDIPTELQDIMKPDTLTDLFGLLDADDSGYLDETEFKDGVFHLALQTIPLETTQVLQLLRSQAQELRLIKEMARTQE